MIVVTFYFEAADPGPKHAAQSPSGHHGAHREGGAIWTAGAWRTGLNTRFTVNLNQEFLYSRLTLFTI